MLLRQLHIDLERALAGVMADLADDHRRLLHDLQACDVMVDALRYAASMTLTCGPHAHRREHHRTYARPFYRACALECWSGALSFVCRCPLPQAGWRAVQSHVKAVFVAAGMGRAAAGVSMAGCLQAARLQVCIVSGLCARGV